MSEKLEAQVGDWIRFYLNGRLVIGKIEYIATDPYSARTHYMTDAGDTTEYQEIKR